MTYRVEITMSAEQDAHGIHAHIADSSPLNAARWFDSLIEVILGLEDFPQRGPIAP